MNLCSNHLRFIHSLTFEFKGQLIGQIN